LIPCVYLSNLFLTRAPHCFPTRRSSDLAGARDVYSCLGCGGMCVKVADYRKALAKQNATFGSLLPTAFKYPLQQNGYLNAADIRSEEHTSELQSPYELVCRLLLEKKETF